MTRICITVQEVVLHILVFCLMSDLPYSCILLKDMHIFFQFAFFFPPSFVKFNCISGGISIMKLQKKTKNLLFSLSP